MATSDLKMIGPWIKRRKLGQGGNGEVWNCKHISTEEMVAVKFLKRPNLGSATYRRFCDEIKLMRDLVQRKNILPLLSSNLPPEDNNPSDIPWLAMPEAKPLKDGFPSQTSLEEMIGGFYEVATALSELSNEGIHHRDVKPQNLFIYNNEITIGDFGLATYPGKQALTIEGEKLGPLYYIAPEMLEYQKGIDESRADVYSLAKTLWVLITGQRYPPPGEQRASESATSISKYILHYKSYLLDRLIELATRYDPSKRIGLKDFAEELNAWNTMGSASPLANLSENIAELNNRLQTALSTSVSSEERAKEYKRLYDECKKTLVTPLQELKGKLPSLENISVSLGEDCALTGMVGVKAGILEGAAIVFCGPGKTHRPLLFTSLGLIDSGEEKTLLMAHHVIKIEQITQPELIWTESREVILGGSTLRLAIDELLQGLTNHFEEAFQRYTELIEQYKDSIH